MLGAGKVQADINGDGYGDLITSTLLYDDDRSGALVVLFGSATGLRTTGQQRLDPSDLPAPGIDAFLIDDIVTGDFDGDGFDDLAIANPRAMIGSDESAGVVYIVPGSATGLDLAAAKTWSQSSPGVTGSPSRLEEFGSALAAADFGGGPEIDLAIGVRGERADQNFTYGSGIVQVLYGSPTGLTGTGSQVWSQDTRGVPGKAENSDFFGEDLAAGNFDGKNKADLAVGVPWENHSGEGNAGAVTVIYSSASKLSATGSESWSQSSRGIAGKAEHNDFFGNTLAAGNFTGSSRDDLAISAISEEFSGRTDTGVGDRAQRLVHRPDRQGQPGVESEAARGRERDRRSPGRDPGGCRLRSQPLRHDPGRPADRKPARLRRADAAGVPAVRQQRRAGAGADHRARFRIVRGRGLQHSGRRWGPVRRSGPGQLPENSWARVSVWRSSPEAPAGLPAAKSRALPAHRGRPPRQAGSPADAPASTPTRIPLIKTATLGPSINSSLKPRCRVT